MLKALLKKQMLELGSFFFPHNRKGKRRSKGATVGFALLMLYAFGSIVVMFWLLSGALCETYVNAGLTWVYFAFIATLATAFGIIGGVFTAKSKLYEAKDNELLLSMPVPSWMILFSRILGLYAITFLFEGVVFLPAVVRYFTVVGFAPLSALFLLLITLILPFGALSICCLLGWLIALITARLRAKNLFTVLLSLAFMAGYVALYSKLNEYLVYVMEHGEAVGEAMKTALYPFYQVGLAATGQPLAMLIFVGMFGGAFAIVYMILSKTYLRIVTMNRGGKRTKYKAKEAKTLSVGAALLKRETMRFFKSAVYFMNCSMGTIFMVIVTALCLIKGDLFGLNADMVAANVLSNDVLGLIVAAVACLVAAMNLATAPSVSLEGENLWIVQCLPVPAWELLKAKLALHVLVTVLPTTIMVVVAGVVLELGGLWIALALVTAAVFTFLTAAFGLAVNLKLPNLRWTNETAAVKQSLSVLIAMFGNLGFVLLLVGGYFLFGRYMPAAWFVAACVGVILLACVLLTLWLKKRGAKIFENL